MRNSFVLTYLKSHVSRLKPRKSALWESNPPRQLGRLAPLPLGQGHDYRSAAAAGIEPASGRLTAAYPYQHGFHRKRRVKCEERRMKGSRFHSSPFTLQTSSERPAGVEPARPPWQGGRQPLHHGRVLRSPNCQRARAPGGTRTHVAADHEYMVPGVRNLGR